MDYGQNDISPPVTSTSVENDHQNDLSPPVTSTSSSSRSDKIETHTTHQNTNHGTDNENDCQNGTGATVTSPEPNIPQRPTTEMKNSVDQVIIELAHMYVGHIESYMADLEASQPSMDLGRVWISLIKQDFEFREELSRWTTDQLKWFWTASHQGLLTLVDLVRDSGANEMAKRLGKPINTRYISFLERLRG